MVTERESYFLSHSGVDGEVVSFDHHLPVKPSYFIVHVIFIILLLLTASFQQLLQQFTIYNYYKCINFFQELTHCLSECPHSHSCPQVMSTWARQFRQCTGSEVSQTSGFSVSEIYRYSWQLIKSEQHLIESLLLNKGSCGLECRVVIHLLEGRLFDPRRQLTSILGKDNEY